MSDAIYIIINPIVTRTLTINPDWSKFFKKYIDPLMIGSCYFNPNFEDVILNQNKFKEFEDFKFMINETITYMAPQDNYDQLAYYKDNMHCFNYLQRKNITDPFQYWNNARRDCPSLSSFAIDLLKLPVIPRKIRIEAIVEVLYNLDIDETYKKYKVGILLKKD